MFIKIPAAGEPSLEDAANFRAFKVVSELPPEEAVASLEKIGRVDGAHVWVDAAWLTANGPDDDGWRAGFAKMVDYAKNSGWLNETGAIRAHVET
jgi:hypothetical protein